MFTYSHSEVQDMDDDSGGPLPSTVITNKPVPVTEDLVHPHKSLCTDEQQEVEEFIKGHEKNSGIIDLLQIYLIELAKRADRQW